MYVRKKRVSVSNLVYRLIYYEDEKVRLEIFSFPVPWGRLSPNTNFVYYTDEERMLLSMLERLEDGKTWNGMSEVFSVVCSVQYKQCSVQSVVSRANVLYMHIVHGTLHTAYGA